MVMAHCNVENALESYIVSFLHGIMVMAFCGIGNAPKLFKLRFIYSDRMCVHDDRVVVMARCGVALWLRHGDDGNGDGIWRGWKCIEIVYRSFCLQ